MTVANDAFEKCGKFGDLVDIEGLANVRSESDDFAFLTRSRHPPQQFAVMHDAPHARLKPLSAQVRMHEAVEFHCAHPGAAFATPYVARPQQQALLIIALRGANDDAVA